MIFDIAYADTCPTISVAARMGIDEVILTKIQNGDRVDIQDNRGWRAIHEAAYSGHATCAKILLDHSTNEVYACTFDGTTPLMLACRHGDSDTTKILLSYHASINDVSLNRTSALHEAVSNKNKECVKLLLDCPDIDVNIQDFGGDTPLKVAAELGHCDIVDLLLSFDARIDITDDNGLTPIFAAAQKGFKICLMSLVKAAESRDQLCLLDKQANDGGTAVFLVAQNGFVECLNILIHYGASANIMTKEPVALPLHAAVEFNQTECVELLLPHTDIDLLKFCSVLPTDLALYPAVSRNRLYMLYLLINNGVNEISCNELLQNFNIRGILSAHFEEHSVCMYTYRSYKLTNEAIVMSFFDFNYRHTYFNSHPIILFIIENINSLMRINILESPSKLNHYCDSATGNLFALTYLYHAIFHASRHLTQPASSFYTSPSMEQFCILILLGAEVRSCLNVNDESGQLSLINNIADFSRFWSLFDVVSFLIFVSEYVYIKDVWRKFLKLDEFSKLQNFAANTRTLHHICRHRIFLILIRNNRSKKDFFELCCLPSLLKEYVWQEPICSSLHEHYQNWLKHKTCTHKW